MLLDTGWLIASQPDHIVQVSLITMPTNSNSRKSHAKARNNPL